MSKLSVCGRKSLQKSLYWEIRRIFSPVFSNSRMSSSAGCCTISSSVTRHGQKKKTPFKNRQTQKKFYRPSRRPKISEFMTLRSKWYSILTRYDLPFSTLDCDPGLWEAQLGQLKCETQILRVGSLEAVRRTSLARHSDQPTTFGGLYL